MAGKNIVLIVLSIVLFALIAMIVIKGFSAATSENNISENPDNGNIQSIQSENEIAAGIQNLLEPEAAGLNFSAEALTCTNISDAEQVIDMRIRNLGSNNESITIYPLNITVDLLPGQIKRKDLYITSEISALRLVSHDGGELTVQIPTCSVSGSSSDYRTASGAEGTAAKPDEIPEFPTVALPVISIMVLLFIIRRTK